MPPTVALGPEMAVRAPVLARDAGERVVGRRRAPIPRAVRAVERGADDVHGDVRRIGDQGGIGRGPHEHRPQVRVVRQARDRRGERGDAGRAREPEGDRCQLHHVGDVAPTHARVVVAETVLVPHRSGGGAAALGPLVPGFGVATEHASEGGHMRAGVRHRRLQVDRAHHADGAAAPFLLRAEARAQVLSRLPRVVVHEVAVLVATFVLPPAQEARQCRVDRLQPSHVAVARE